MKPTTLLCLGLGLGLLASASGVADEGGIPFPAAGKTLLDLSFRQANFAQPVYVDLRTGWVYEIPRDQWSTANGVVKFRQVPVYDSPVLIADRATLPLEP